MTSWEGMVVTVSPSLIADTYMQLRVCGQRRRECHLFWLASWRDPSRITRIVHPKHTASSVSVEIDVEWLNSFFLELADAGDCIRVQVHSHPDSAFHSTTDDTWPAVRMRGYLSLVIPDFATGDPNLEGAYLAEQSSSGGWTTADMSNRINVDRTPPPVAA